MGKPDLSKLEGMKKRVFHYEHVTVEVYYNKLPTKKDLEEPCRRFMQKVYEERARQKQGMS